MTESISHIDLWLHFCQSTQRSVHGGRTYIALYRDGLLGTVEDMSRLVFPRQDSKLIQFLDTINKNRDERKRGGDGGEKKAATVRYALGDTEPRYRPLSERADRKVRCKTL